MEKTLRLLFLLLMIGSLSVDAIAQYIPIPEQNARWMVHNRCGSIEGTSPPYFVGFIEYINYDIAGYQTINGKEYVKITACGNYTDYMFQQYQFSNGIDTSVYNFYFRNDSTNRKVFGLLLTDTLNEFLLNDFNLQVGDSTTLYYQNSNTLSQKGAKVVMVDSVFLKNRYHKRIHFKFGTLSEDSTIMYEGIGFINGLLPASPNYFISLGGCSSKLECFQLDSLTLTNLIVQGDTCERYYCRPYYPSGIENGSYKNIVSLYPNPASNTLHVNIEQNGNYEMSFFNLMGQKIHSQQIDREAIIAVSAWVRGIYCYTISDQKGIASKGKVILE